MTKYISIGVAVVVILLSGFLWVQTKRLESKAAELKTIEEKLAAYVRLADVRLKALENERAATYERTERINNADKAYKELEAELNSDVCDYDVLADGVFERLCGPYGSSGDSRAAKNPDGLPGPGK
jgi:hypothetical protein